MKRGSSVCLELRPSDRLGPQLERDRKDPGVSVPTVASGADFPHHKAEVDGGYTRSFVILYTM